MKRRVYFAVANNSCIMYLGEEPLGEEPKKMLNFCDCIQDIYDLGSEFEWSIEKPTEEGVYRAEVQYIQTAEDDYKLVVLNYEKGTIQWEN